MKVGIIVGTVATLLQMLSGDFTAKGVLKNQPAKFAALEGVYQTEARAPMTVIGWVDPVKETVQGLKIPGLLSFLSYEDTNATVTGLHNIPSDDFLKARYPNASAEEITKIRRSYWPPVPATFQFYHIMISIGVALLVIVVIALFMLWSGGCSRQTASSPGVSSGCLSSACSGRRSRTRQGGSPPRSVASPGSCMSCSRPPRRCPRSSRPTTSWPRSSCSPLSICCSSSSSSSC